MTDKPDESCSNCRYSQPFGTIKVHNGDGSAAEVPNCICRRRAPAPDWPQVLGNGWCGDYECSESAQDAERRHAEYLALSAEDKLTEDEISALKTKWGCIW